MRERFFEPGAFAAFCEGFTAEMSLRRREHIAQLAGARRELAAVERQLHEIMNALGEGYRSEGWKAELVTLDARKAALTIALAEPPLPALHPRIAEVFRQKATTLAAGLEHDEQRDAARQALRGLLEKIVIPAGDGLLQVVGNLGSMLAAAQGRTQSSTIAVGYVGCGGVQPSVLAAVERGGVRLVVLPICRALSPVTALLICRAKERATRPETCQVAFRCSGKNPTEHVECGRPE
jgi:hypothetical protein